MLVVRKKMKRLLVQALKNRFKMTKEDAVALTHTVEDFFNGKKEVEDMTIDKYARALFYELQREKILKIRREEIKEKGKFIRKFYWSFNEKEIRHAAHEQKKEDQINIYQKIPKNAWLIHSAR